MTIFGWSCVVTYRPYGGDTFVEKQIHRRGKTSGRVILAAKQMNAYRSYRDLISYTQDEWVRVFGNGTETGRYRIEGV